MAGSAQFPVSIVECKPMSLQSLMQEASASFDAKILSPAKVGELTDRGPWIIDHCALTPSMWEKLLAARPDGRGIIVVGGNELRPDLAVLLGDYHIRHILGWFPGAPLASLDLNVTLRRLTGGEHTGLKAYLGPVKETYRRSVTRTTEKNGVAAEAIRFAMQKAALNSRFAYGFSTIADEFVMNAFYNAPTKGDGTHRYSHFERKVEVNLQHHEAVQIEMAFDGQRIGISVIDPFGSLTARRLQESMARCMRKGSDQVNIVEAGGAGIGLCHAFEMASHVVVDIKSKVSTEFIGLIDATGTYRDLASRPKSLNIFEGGG
jgi:hypothetical protein